MSGKWLRFFLVALVSLVIFHYFKSHPNEGVAFIAAMVFAYAMFDDGGGK